MGVQHSQTSKAPKFRPLHTFENQERLNWEKRCMLARSTMDSIFSSLAFA
jgi:hypothetical protein